MKETVIVCSTAHMTKADSFQMKYICMDCTSCPWIFDTEFGFILYTGTSRYPLLLMKQHGLSKALRKFAWHMMRSHQARYIHFDRDADVIGEETTFDW